MRILIELDGHRGTFELEAFDPDTTVAQLCAATVRVPVRPEDELFLDGAPTTGAGALRDLVLLEGSHLTRAPQPPIHRVVGWNASVIGGVAAGEVVAIPDHRPLVIGRAPQATSSCPPRARPGSTAP